MVDSYSEEGLRTLVLGRKKLHSLHYQQFHSQYHHIKAQLHRDLQAEEALLNTLETGLELLAVTAIEDKLQDNVKPTI